MRKSNFDLYLSKLKAYYWDKWVIPTFDVMIDLLWISSRDSIARFFTKLVAEEYLTKDDKKYFPTSKLSWAGLYGNIACWVADEIESNIVNYIDLNKYILGWNPTWVVLVEVKWDSMIDVWIFEWDIVSVDLNNKYPHVWDLVVASINWDNEFTLKRYWKDKNWKVVLEYQNDKKYWDKIIEATQINIIWVVKGLVRKF